MRVRAQPGPGDCFTDVGGLGVGHAVDETIRTGVTAIIPDTPVVMGVDVRGGGPGTRDTEALKPDCLVEAFHGLVLSGGSVFGLAAADGAVQVLSDRGIGLPLGDRAVPVVPSAILFDLMNGGDKNWGETSPYYELGQQATRKAGGPCPSGRVGAGYGALCGGEPGGIGTASLRTEDGITVSVLIAVNSFGPRMQAAGGPPAVHGIVDLPKLGLVGANTTIGAVATDARLTKADCQRLAIMAQDGLARAIRPIHTPYDGDTVFALATGEKEIKGDKAGCLTVLGTLAADCVVKAIARAVGGDEA